MKKGKGNEGKHGQVDGRVLGPSLELRPAPIPTQIARSVAARGCLAAKHSGRVSGLAQLRQRKF